MIETNKISKLLEIPKFKWKRKCKYLKLISQDGPPKTIISLKPFVGCPSKFSLFLSCFTVLILSLSTAGASPLFDIYDGSGEHTNPGLPLRSSSPSRSFVHHNPGPEIPAKRRYKEDDDSVNGFANRRDSDTNRENKDVDSNAEPRNQGNQEIKAEDPKPREIKEETPISEPRDRDFLNREIKPDSNIEPREKVFQNQERQDFESRDQRERERERAMISDFGAESKSRDLSSVKEEAKTADFPDQSRAAESLEQRSLNAETDTKSSRNFAEPSNDNGAVDSLVNEEAMTGSRALGKGRSGYRKPGRSMGSSRSSGSSGQGTAAVPGAPIDRAIATAEAKQTSFHTGKKSGKSASAWSRSAGEGEAAEGASGSETSSSSASESSSSSHKKSTTVEETADGTTAAPAAATEATEAKAESSGASESSSSGSASETSSGSKSETSSGSASETSSGSTSETSSGTASETSSGSASETSSGSASETSSGSSKTETETTSSDTTAAPEKAPETTPAPAAETTPAPEPPAAEASSGTAETVESSSSSKSESSSSSSSKTETVSSDASTSTTTEATDNGDIHITVHWKSEKETVFTINEMETVKAMKEMSASDENPEPETLYDLDDPALDYGPENNEKELRSIVPAEKYKDYHLYESSAKKNERGMDVSEEEPDAKIIKVTVHFKTAGAVKFDMLDTKKLTKLKAKAGETGDFVPEILYDRVDTKSDLSAASDEKALKEFVAAERYDNYEVYAYQEEKSDDYIVYKWPQK